MIRWLLLAPLFCVASPASAQLIDFETAGGLPTTDLQIISTEYGILGVSFSLLDPISGTPIGFPRIAKAGIPQTAFEGCMAADTPRDNLGLGNSFLTDGTALGVDGDLLIEYATPVAQASGVVLDIDCRSAGGPPCEQWTITGYDSLGTVIDTAILDAPVGSPRPECLSPQAGPGDSEAFGWVLSSTSANIQSILLKHTGAASNVGLAFDNFSISAIPGPPTVEIGTAINSACLGANVRLEAAIGGGVPPHSYRWQRETSPGVWQDLGTHPTQDVSLLESQQFRLIVTDSMDQETISDPHLISVVPLTDPLCETELLVCMYSADRVLSYDFINEQPEVRVNSGSGGLDGASEAVCTDDGFLYVVSQINNSVRRFDLSTGAFIDVFVPANSGGLDVPVGMDFGPDGNLYVVSNANQSIKQYDGITGAYLDTFIPNGSGLNTPTGMIFGPDDNLYVSSLGSDSVLRFDGATGLYIDDFVTSGSGGLDGPRGLVFGPDGNLYVAEQEDDSVSRYDGATGAFMDVFIASGSGGLDRANDVAFGPNGRLYVASFDNSMLLAYDGATGSFLTALETSPTDGVAWFAVGCSATATAVEPAFRSPTQVRFDFAGRVGRQLSFSVHLESAADLELIVYDSRGRAIKRVAQGHHPAGSHLLHWNQKDGQEVDVARGVYFAQLRAMGAHFDERVTRKILVIY